MRTEKKEIIGQLSFKLIIIAVISLLLLIPAAFIQSLIREREHRSKEVVTDIGNKWANKQIICGPVLTVNPSSISETEESFLNKNDKIITSKKYQNKKLTACHFLPDALNITTDINTQTRHRGIYDAIVYTSTVKMSGSFPVIDIAELFEDEKDLKIDKINLGISLSDLKGLAEIKKVVIAGKEYDMEAQKFEWAKNSPRERYNEFGTKQAFSSIAGKGMGCKLNIDPKKTIDFVIEFTLKGSKGIGFVPLGKNSSITANANWGSPSFIGSSLPLSHSIDKESFTANWKSLSINREYPQKWLGNTFSFDNSVFGVDFIIESDIYQQAMRSVKYALLFIMLTFVAIFLIEVICRKKIHPFQYLLIGAGLVVFYVLLISLSEHIQFWWAYFVAALAITVQLGLFTKQVFNSNKQAGISSAIIALLYFLLYIILQLTDYSLLVGSIFLFIALGTVMYFSRYIEWYSNKDSE